MHNIAVLNTDKNLCTQVKQVGAGYVVTEFDVIVPEFDFNLVGKSYDVNTGFTEYVAPQPELIPIIINSVSNTLTGFEDGPNQYTVAELTDVIATGTLAVADSKFRVPFKRDDGAIRFMVAEVVGGVFTLTMNFKTGGKWIVNQELVDSSYPAPVFGITEQTFMVI